MVCPKMPRTYQLDIRAMWFLLNILAARTPSMDYCRSHRTHRLHALHQIHMWKWQQTLTCMPNIQWHTLVSASFSVVCAQRQRVCAIYIYLILYSLLDSRLRVGFFFNSVLFCFFPTRTRFFQLLIALHCLYLLCNADRERNHKMKTRTFVVWPCEKLCCK